MALKVLTETWASVLEWTGYQCRNTKMRLIWFPSPSKPSSQILLKVEPSDFFVYSPVPDILQQNINLFKISHTELFFIFEGIGMDTCVIPLRHGGLSLVQTTDYIYPIVDDPYMMVWISASLQFALMWSCYLYWWVWFRPNLHANPLCA